MNNTSFSEHARHVKQDGFSCSVCHTAHGMGAQSGTISGERLVNFDANVVAPNGASSHLLQPRDQLLQPGLP